MEIRDRGNVKGDLAVPAIGLTKLWLIEGGSPRSNSAISYSPRLKKESGGRLAGDRMLICLSDDSKKTVERGSLSTVSLFLSVSFYY